MEYRRKYISNRLLAIVQNAIQLGDFQTTTQKMYEKKRFNVSLTPPSPLNAYVLYGRSLIGNEFWLSR